MIRLIYVIGVCRPVVVHRGFFSVVLCDCKILNRRPAVFAYATAANQWNGFRESFSIGQ